MTYSRKDLREAFEAYKDTVSVRKLTMLVQVSLSSGTTSKT